MWFRSAAAVAAGRRWVLRNPCPTRLIFLISRLMAAVGPLGTAPAVKRASSSSRQESRMRASRCSSADAGAVLAKPALRVAPTRFPGAPTVGP